MKNKINIEIEVKPNTILSIITTAHDSGACNYFLMKRPKWLDYKWHGRMEKDPSLWLKFRWVLCVDDGSDTGKNYVITYRKVVLGLQKMVEDKAKGKYFNKYHDPIQVIVGNDFGDAIFCSEVLQYAMFGKLIYG